MKVMTQANRFDIDDLTTETSDREYTHAERFCRGLFGTH